MRDEMKIPFDVPPTKPMRKDIPKKPTPYSSMRRIRIKRKRGGGRRRQLADKERNAYYLSKYGITLDQYNSMLAAQSGRCSICGSVKEVLFVDHCHESGRVRELLCSSCNSALGLFRDSVIAVKRAHEYLIRHKSSAYNRTAPSN